MDDNLVLFRGFDLHLRTGELRRDGRVVPMERQPALVLRHLVARAGRLVTREELRDVVWGPGTFVDFDRGLNYCIRQVRATLGDDARAPMFVETVPRQGYRFVAPVAPIGSTPAPGATRGSRWAAAFAAALLVVSTLTVAFHERNPRHHRMAVAALRAVHDLVF
jgi:DNA-binding winged helix-turn-helix (wHTH) protein